MSQIRSTPCPARCANSTARASLFRVPSAVRSTTASAGHDGEAVVTCVNRRPPGASCPARAEGTCRTAYDWKIRSNGPRSGQPSPPAPHTRCGRNPRSARRPAADSTRCRSRSRETTPSSPQTWQATAAVKPAPVPTSSTRCPGRRSSSCNSSAVMPVTDDIEEITPPDRAPRARPSNGSPSCCTSTLPPPYSRPRSSTRSGSAPQSSKSHRGGSSPGALRRTYACGIRTSRRIASSASRTVPGPSRPAVSSRATIASRATTGSAVPGTSHRSPRTEASVSVAVIVSTPCPSTGGRR